MTQYLTPQDLAERFQCSAESVRRMARAKVWPSTKIGRLTRFHPDDVAAIEALIRTPATRPEPVGSIPDLMARAGL